MTSLIVLGSINRDLTVVVERHPLPGETVLGGSIASGTGGKGANQAAAAARTGAHPVFIGAVGQDSVGDELLADLTMAGVDVSHVVRSTEPSGVALITVDRAGENSIVVASGANATLDAAATSGLIRTLSDETTVLLAQLEIPLGVVEDAADALERVGGRFVLNLSPSTTVSPRLLGYADPLVVNESEASELAGTVIDSPADAEAIAKRLLDSCRSVVITLGGDGVVVAAPDGVFQLPSEKVTVVDTTGAGDAFAGALAASLAQGGDLTTAVQAGIAAGAEAVQHLGAQPPVGDDEKTGSGA